jgi:hypothetical protein
MIEAISASSSANEVSMRTLTAGKLERMSRQASIPERSGMRTSITTTSGSSSPTRRSASSALLASPTTSMSS